MGRSNRWDDLSVAGPWHVHDLAAVRLRHWVALCGRFLDLPRRYRNDERVSMLADGVGYGLLGRFRCPEVVTRSGSDTFSRGLL